MQQNTPEDDLSTTMSRERTMASFVMLFHIQIWPFITWDKSNVLTGE